MFGRLLGGELRGHCVLWVSFALPVVVLLLVDFTAFLRTKQEPTLKESLGWTALWTAAAIAFGLGLTAMLGATEGLAFFTSYVVEQALSVDNLFVFMLVFAELAVPAEARKRALAYGVLAALVLRIAMLIGGADALHHVHAFGWLLGAVLVAMGVRAGRKLLGPKDDEEISSAKTLALVDRVIPVHDRFDEDRFFTDVGGRPYATPLFVAVLMILFADVVFAFDSVPAVLGVSTNPIVVVTSNVFAVLGLRAMFFVVSRLLARLRYLPHGLAAVLVVVGAKMLLGAVIAIPTWLSLASVLGVLGVAVYASLRGQSEQIIGR